MSRGIGEFHQIQDLIPEWLAVVIALVTQLGDIWFLTVVLAGLYWFDVPDQDDVAMLAGVWLAGMGLYKGLKEVFGFPRPNEPLLNPDLLPWFVEPVYEATAMATGYGFPSGHAVNTTVVFFGLAAILSVSTFRRRLVIAASLVTIVCFTRVALGVHYVVDVVVGVAVGLALLAGAWALTNRRPTDKATLSFGLAVGFGVFFLVTSDVDADAVFLLGASLGAFSGWQIVVLGRKLVYVSRPSSAVGPIAFRGGLAAVALAPLIAALEFFPLLSVYTAGGVVGLVAATIVIVPVLRYSHRARRVGIAVTFWVRTALGGLRSLLAPDTWLRLFARLREFTRRVGHWAATRLRRFRSNSR